MKRSSARVTRALGGRRRDPEEAAMSNQVKMDHPGAQELLASAPLLRLAYAGLDGLPRVIPIGFHWDGERVFVCTAPSAPKVAALYDFGAGRVPRSYACWEKRNRPPRGARPDVDDPGRPPRRPGRRRRVDRGAVLA